MIPYMVDKLAPDSTHSTRRLVKIVPGRGYFRAVPSQNGEKMLHPLLLSIVERVKKLGLPVETFLHYFLLVRN